MAVCSERAVAVSASRSSSVEEGWGGGIGRKADCSE